MATGTPSHNHLIPLMLKHFFSHNDDRTLTVNRATLTARTVTVNVTVTTVAVLVGETTGRVETVRGGRGSGR